MGRFIDISGQRFGRLVVLKRVGTASSGAPTWSVRCDCGVEKILRRTELYATKSCGCLHRRVNLVGKRFGKLMVTGWDSVDGSGNSMWRCVCDCGNVSTVVGHQLNSGGTKSCGCLRVLGQRRAADAVRLSYGTGARNTVLALYKKVAKRNGREWGLSDSEFDTLTALPCRYCGTPPSNCKTIKKGNGEFVYTGIDRTDNTCGYVLENVVPCCAVCNRMKRDLPLQTFLAHISKIQVYYGKQTIQPSTEAFSNPLTIEKVQQHG